MEMATSRTAVFAGMAILLLSSVSPLSARAAQSPQTFAPDRNDQVARSCDLLASRPDDPQRVGNGVEFEKIDVGPALPVCRSAAERSPARPRYQYLYGRVLHAAKRYSEAVQQYAASDRGGYAWGSSGLGSLYQAGQGVPQDLPIAASLYQRAGDAGYADAYAVAVALHLSATPPNYVQAYALSDRAARAGSHWGTAFLGELYFGGLGVAKDEARGMSLFRQAADRGNPGAMLDLGVVYFSGIGVPQDKATALRWITRAGDLGIPEAQNLAGYMYEEGDGVTQSDQQAIAWYRKSAAQGDAFGMMHLGKLLSNAGNGAEAVELYRKAAALGFVEAYVALARDYLSGGDGLPRDPTQEAFWFGKAAEKGDRSSMISLGELYEFGIGVERNEVRARQLYMQAAGNHNDDLAEDARDRVARLDRAASQAAPRNASPSPQPAISPPNNTPDPRRPSPTEPSASGNSGISPEMVILGAIGIAVASWLFSGSSSGSSDGGYNPDPANAADPNAWGRNSLGQPCMYGSSTCY
jgi:TPR repeat protein